MIGMTENVHKKEDYTLRYLMTEILEGDEPEFIMIETYVQTLRPRIAILIPNTYLSLQI